MKSSVTFIKAPAHHTFSFEQIKNMNGVFRPVAEKPGDGMYENYRIVSSGNSVFFGITASGDLFDPRGDWRLTRYLLADEVVKLELSN